MDVALDVLTWGSSPQGETGHSTQSMEVTEPTVLECLTGKDIVAISSANYHSLALSRDGVVWAWGKNTWGQCGTGMECPAVTPTMVQFDEDEPVCIVQIECGGYHSLALSAMGDVYAWGRNTFGQLGLGTTSQHCRPVLVEALRGKGVVQVKAGRSFSLALDEHGAVYSWGLGVHGQLGQGNSVNLLVPTIISSLTGLSFALLQCGNRHCCALTDDGDVYVWGQGPKEQVLIMAPTCVPTGRSREVRRLQCGGLHTLALTAAGEVCSWGDGTFGQLGHCAHPNKAAASSVEPKVVSALTGHRVSFIAAGFYSSFAATDKGDIYAWGCNPRQVQAARLKFGQTVFGIEASGIPKLVPCLSQRRVVALACGYEHYVALAERKTELRFTQTLQTDLASTLNDPTYSDTTLVVDSQTVHCHRLLLACRCPHFARMFASGMKEAQPPYRVEIPEYKYNAFYAFLEHLYSDKTDFPPDICMELLEITHSFSVPVLKAACSQKLMSLITMDNVTQLLATADQFQVQDLKHSCLNFIVDHLNEVTGLEGFASLNKECYLDILKFASQKNMTFEKRIPMPRRGTKRRALPSNDST